MLLIFTDFGVGVKFLSKNDSFIPVQIYNCMIIIIINNIIIFIGFDTNIRTRTNTIRTLTFHVKY